MCFLLSKFWRKDVITLLYTEIGQRLVDQLELVRIQPQNILNISPKPETIGLLLGKRFRTSKVFNLTPDNLCPPPTRIFQWPKKSVLTAKPCQLPFPDHTFDLVISNLMLQRYQNLPELLQELQRVLIPGGLLQFSTLGPHTLLKPQDVKQSDEAPILPYSSFDTQQLGDLLAKNRFQDPVVFTETITFAYSNALKLKSDFTAFLNYEHQFNTNHEILKNRSEQIQDTVASQQLNLNFEIIYGHAWIPLINKDIAKYSNETYIPLSSIRKK